ncbi:MAG: cadherin-like domain-containing protein [Gammaproteobacteria bacterium]|nr:cadherin-like domain-containing protein [Gammaproteobacteria bacterium]
MLRRASFTPASFSPAQMSGAGFVSANNPPVTPPSPVTLGPIVIGEPIVITAAQLLSGASDIDGDALSVASLSVTAGSGTITGTGPWIFAASAAGNGVISYTINDGDGGTATGTITYNAAANLWVHSSVNVSGGSQILGSQRYRVYSPDGSFASAQFNNVLSGKNGLQYRFRLEVESFAAGTQLVMGDDIGNDITITGAGVKVGTWTVNGPTAMIKRSSGHTDAIVKDVYLRAV